MLLQIGGLPSPLSLLLMAQPNLLGPTGGMHIPAVVEIPGSCQKSCDGVEQSKEPNKSPSQPANHLGQHQRSFHLQVYGELAVGAGGMNEWEGSGLLGGREERGTRSEEQEERGRRDGSASHGAHQLLSLLFPTSLPLSCSWTRAIKIGGVCPRRPNAAQAAYQGVSRNFFY